LPQVSNNQVLGPGSASVTLWINNSCCRDMFKVGTPTIPNNTNKRRGDLTHLDGHFSVAESAKQARMIVKTDIYSLIPAEKATIAHSAVGSRHVGTSAACCIRPCRPLRRHQPTILAREDPYLDDRPPCSHQLVERHYAAGPFRPLVTNLVGLLNLT
jgi:hypothetical protein